jgi:hypothetical protein
MIHTWSVLISSGTPGHPLGLWYNINDNKRSGYPILMQSRIRVFLETANIEAVCQKENRTVFNDATFETNRTD